MGILLSCFLPKKRPEVDDDDYNTFRPPPKPLPFVCRTSTTVDDASAGTTTANSKTMDIIGTSDKQPPAAGDDEPEDAVRALNNSSPVPENNKHTKTAVETNGTQSSVLKPSVDEPEDDDCCMICLDDYCSDNPKILLQCTHHFHLACVYEWMERSSVCPWCGNVMLFVQ